MNIIKALAVLVALTYSGAAQAHDGVHINDAFVIVASKTAKAGAAFMVIENHQTVDDRLLSATTDAAAKAELHTHVETADGVMMMREVPEGFGIAAGNVHALKRGGDHVMLMGLTRGLVPGDVVTLTLTFEQAGVVVVDVPVVPMDAVGHEGMNVGGADAMDHSKMGHTAQP